MPQCVQSPRNLSQLRADYLADVTVIQLLSLLLALYVAWRLVARLGLPKYGVYLLSLLLVAVSQYHRVLALFWGSRASPEVPGVILMLLGGLLGVIIISACLLFVLDSVGGIAWLIHQRSGRYFLQARGPRLAIGIIALTLSPIAVGQAVKVPDIQTIEVHIPGLASEFDGFRLVQLTDLHASRLLQADWMDAVVNKTNALSPDMIVITGDLADGTVSDRLADIAPLAHLHAKYGVYAVVGNHEYYTNYQSWLQHFSQIGIQLLLNEHRLISKGHGTLALAGITDTVSSKHRQATPDIKAALQGVPSGIPIIALSHRPSEAATNAAAGVDLQLSGHTHGGQILGLHKVVEKANGGFIAGMYQVEDMLLYVSTGTGLWAGFPLRLGVPAEITEIILRPAR